MRRLRRPAGGLWKHADFLKLWTGQSISELGTQVSQLAIPIVAAIALHASPIVFSLLTVLGFLPFILFALPAGAWVDRMRRRRILIVGDAARAVLLATIPLAYWLDLLTIWQLLVIEFVVGVFTVFFDVAYQSYLPQLVHRDHLKRSPTKRGVPLVAALVGAGLETPRLFEHRQVLSPLDTYFDLAVVVSGVRTAGRRRSEQTGLRRDSFAALLTIRTHDPRTQSQGKNRTALACRVVFPKQSRSAGKPAGFGRPGGDRGRRPPRSAPSSPRR